MQRPPRRPGAKAILHDNAPPYETPSTKNIPKLYPLYPIDRILEKWFGVREVPRNIVLGKGNFGIVLLLKITREMRDAFSKVRFAFKYVDVVTSRTGVWRVPRDKVAVKVVLGWSKLVKKNGRPDGARENDAMQQSIAGIRREIDVLKALSTTEPVTIGGKIYDVTRVIPKLHAAGYDAQMHAGVIVMQALPKDTWVTLYALMESIDKGAKSKLVPIQSVYQKYRWVRTRLEYALTSLYVAGYVHMDLHAKNISVNVAAKKLKIIDFGSSVKMPTDLRNEFRGIVAQTGPVRKTLTEFWDQKLQRFADSVIRGRIATYFGTVPNTYHHNVNIIDHLASRYDSNYSRLADFTTPSVSVQNRVTPTTVVTVGTNRNNASVKGRTPGNFINLAGTNSNSGPLGRSNGRNANSGPLRPRSNGRKRKRSSNGNSGPLR